MSESVATISSKGQVTLPASVRRHLGVGASDKIVFVVRNDGGVELRPVRFTLESVLGSIPALPNETEDLDREIEEAMTAEADGVVRRLEQR